MAKWAEADEGPPGFRAAVAEIDARVNVSGAPVQKLEAEYLALLKRPHSDAQTGLLYAHVGRLFVSNGVGQGDVAEAYYRDALRYPTPSGLAAEAWQEIACLACDRYQHWPRQRLVVGRLYAAQIGLQALRFALDNGAPNITARVPMGRFYTLAGGGEKTRRWIAEQERKERAAREKAINVNQLYRVRKRLTQLLATEYKRPPGAPEGLRHLVTKALTQYPETLQEVTAGLPPVSSAAARPQPPSASLTAALQVVDDHVKAGQATAEKLEDDYLALLAQPHSPEQTGLVYAHIGHMFSCLGATNADVAEAYFNDALHYPLPLAVAAQVHGDLARTLLTRYDKWSERRFAIARPYAASVALDSLRFALQARAIKAKGETAAAVHRLHDDMIDLLVSEYHRPPDVFGELDDLAYSGLPKHPEVAREIMERLKAGK